MTRLVQILFHLVLVLMPSLSFAYKAKDEIRRDILINSDWAFNYQPSGILEEKFSSPDFDESRWVAVAVPHTWFTYETTGDIHPFIHSAAERDDAYWWNGWGWYRKHIVFDSLLKGKKIFIEFEAVQKYARVYINGHFLGEHKGGYSGFYFDLTPYVRYGEDNVISVAVSARRDDKFGTIAPATAGNFNTYGGLYRDVHIVIKESIYIPYQGSYLHEGGTFVTTPEVSADSARFNLKTYVKNEAGCPRMITLKSIVTDAEGKRMQIIESTSKIGDGEIFCFEQMSARFDNPHLWSPENPYLYNIYSEVYDECGRLLDTYRTPLGFRYFHWDKEAHTLVLNGKPMHIHGINRHQEYPWLGDAVPRWMAERDVLDMTVNLNVNFQRTAHYPQASFIYDMHDMCGIVTVEEVPNNKNIDFDPTTQEQNVREMVRRDRNHPSIMFWSVGNETSCPADSRWVFEEDKTRIIHERKTEGYGNYVTHHANDLDMENLLRVSIRGWTDTDVRNLEPKNSAEVPKSGQHAGTEEWQHTMARVQDGSIRGRIDGNIVCWLYADHGCDRIYKDAPLKNINYKGWVDLYRFPKYMYRLWQANYCKYPMVYIHPHYWRDKYLGQKKNIRVDSNCPEVELFIGGKRLGIAHPSSANFHTVEFSNVEVTGETITAVARGAGVEVRDSVQMAGPPYAVNVTYFHDDILKADRSGLAVVVADIVDKHGNRVQGFSGTLKWQIAGEGTLVGPETYTSDINYNLNTSGTGYIVTPISNIVRTTGNEGLITVTVSAEGLKEGVVTFASVRPDNISRDGVIQHQLSDEGRCKVLRDTMFAEKVEYLQEMAPIFGPEQIDAESIGEYRTKIKQLVVGHNPDIDVRCVEFKYLIDRLTTYIENTHGELTEDDYNFLARTYNDLRMVSRVIDNRNFHPLYAKKLKTDLSQRILINGELLDIDEIISDIRAVPSLLDIVLVRDPDNSSQIAKVQYGNTTYRYSVVAESLEEVVGLLHPKFRDMDSESRARILETIVEINPDVRYEGGKYFFKFNEAIAIPRKLK